MAGPAQVDQSWGSAQIPADEQPCADAALLIPLKKSREYRELRARVASPRAIDSWQEEGLHFFVFQLRAVDATAAPVAVFTMRAEEIAPLSVVVVTPSADGEAAEIVNLNAPDSAYVASLEH